MTESIENLPDYNRILPELECTELEVTAACNGQRLDQALASLLPAYSRSRLQAWIKEGHVRLNGKQVAPRQTVWEGDVLEVEEQLSAEALAFQAEDIPLDIVFEDESLLVINKPAGLVVHPGSGNWQGTLLNGLLHHAPALACVPRAGIVHRLDKETSGLLVVAKSLTAQTDLVRQLQARTVKREYLALVQGFPDLSGTVDAPVGRHSGNRVKMAVTPVGKPAITHFEVLESYAQHSLIRCRLETGRTHQIRVHMQFIGFPLLGDPVYNGKGLAVSEELRPVLREFTRQALHATQLGLVHPASGEKMEWQAEPPEDMADLIEVLQQDAE
jgi:23S rRNA pseudouridine1911/1915/1917 synthase